MGVRAPLIIILQVTPVIPLAWHSLQHLWNFLFYKTLHTFSFQCVLLCFTYIIILDVCLLAMQPYCSHSANCTERRNIRCVEKCYKML